MGKAYQTYKEVRFCNLDGELTECYVLIEGSGDVPLGVDGWHFKAFPPSVPVVEIVTKEITNAVMWPLQAPSS